MHTSFFVFSHQAVFGQTEARLLKPAGEQLSLLIYLTDVALKKLRRHKPCTAFRKCRLIFLRSKRHYLSDNCLQVDRGVLD